MMCFPIATFTQHLHEIQVKAARPHGRIGWLSLNVGVYVPKPETPLGELGFCGISEARRRIHLLRRALRRIPNIKVHFESPREAAAQAALSTGGREYANVIETAVLQGKRIIEIPSHL